MFKLLLALATMATISVGDKALEDSDKDKEPKADELKVDTEELNFKPLVEVLTPEEQARNLESALAEQQEKERREDMEVLRKAQSKRAFEKEQAERAEQERIAVAQEKEQVEQQAQREHAEQVQAYNERIEQEEKAKQAVVEQEEAVAVQPEPVQQEPAEEERTDVTNSETMLLARLVMAEANGEPYSGLVAVAEVVLNRVNSGQYPNSIEGVVYQSGQFSPVSDGSINNSPSDQAINAVNEAMAGTNYTGGSLFFYNPATATSRWLDSKPTNAVIGNHHFK